VTVGPGQSVYVSASTFFLPDWFELTKSAVVVIRMAYQPTGGTLTLAGTGGQFVTLLGGVNGFTQGSMSVVISGLAPGSYQVGLAGHWAGSTDTGVLGAEAIGGDTAALVFQS
jgi:hypothetical protein